VGPTGLHEHADLLFCLACIWEVLARVIMTYHTPDINLCAQGYKTLAKVISRAAHNRRMPQS
jgi:hypothetical protein